MSGKKLWFGTLALGVVLVMAGLLAVSGVPVPGVVAQGGTPTPDEFGSNIFMWDGGNLMVVADGGEIEVQSGAVLEVQSGATFNLDGSLAIDGVGGYLLLGDPTPAVITTPAAGDLITKDDVEVQGDLDVDGTTDLDVVDIDSYVNIAIPTAQATDVPGLTISNSSVAASLVIDGGEAVVDELNADFVVVAVPTAQGTAVPGLKITNSSVAASLLIDGGEAVVDELNADFVVVSAPTAQATSVPALQVNQAGVGLGLEVASGPVTIAETLGVTGMSTLTGGATGVLSTENIMFPTMASADVTYQSSGAIFTIGAGEIWVVHDVFLEVTTDFDTAGNNDATLTIGDANDTDGFITLADAELQAADTEATGFSAGWQGQLAANKGVYLDGAAGSQNFIYDESGEETIDIACGGTAADAGAATVYIWYTRIQ